MYARSIIDDKLSEFRKKYGWKPEEHSVEEIDLFNKKLESYYVTDKHGDKVFSDEKLTPGIAHWMKNERALVALDCSYFLTRYFWLTENEIQRFAFRSGQKAFYSVVARLEEKGVSQEIQCLKARKQGISTVVEGIDDPFCPLRARSAVFYRVCRRPEDRRHDGHDVRRPGAHPLVSQTHPDQGQAVRQALCSSSPASVPPSSCSTEP